MGTTRRTGATPGTRRSPAKASRASRGAGTTRRRAAPARGPAHPADQLVAGVLDVKKALDQTLAQFSARVGGGLGEVLRSLESDSPAATGDIKEMVKRIQSVRLKPEKGRLKDIVRVHDLVEELVAMLPGR